MISTEGSWRMKKKKGTSQKDEKANAAATEDDEDVVVLAWERMENKTPCLPFSRPRCYCTAKNPPTQVGK